jgi:hypothetical protein
MCIAVAVKFSFSSFGTLVDWWTPFWHGVLTLGYCVWFRTIEPTRMNPWIAAIAIAYCVIAPYFLLFFSMMYLCGGTILIPVLLAIFVGLPLGFAYRTRRPILTAALGGVLFYPTVMVRHWLFPNPAGSVVGEDTVLTGIFASIGYLAAVAANVSGVHALHTSVRRRLDSDCKSCGYDMMGLQTTRCPECGTISPGSRILDSESPRN